jgi:predicted DNA-binding protein
MKNTFKIKGLTITSETEVKLVKFDESPSQKRSIKIKEITSKQIQDVIDLYRDLYVNFNGRYMQVSPTDAGHILFNLINTSKQTKNHINKFIDFETAVERNMRDRSLKISID